MRMPKIPRPSRLAKPFFRARPAFRPAVTCARLLSVMPTKSNGSAEFSRATRAAKFIHSKTKLRPRIALVLGSGLGAFADEFDSAIKIPYAKIPQYPRSTAIGHAGQLVVG